VNPATASLPGLAPAFPNNTTTFLRGDGTYQTPPTSGQMILLATLTASTSASLNDATACGGSNCLTGTYSAYELVFENILPATNNTGCQLQVHSGGSYQTTTYVASTWSFNGTATGSTSVTTYIPCSAQNAALSNVSPGLSGTMRVFGPVTGTSLPKLWTALMMQGGGIGGGAGGSWNNNAAIDGFQVLMLSGNITSGVIKIYGIQ